jgi:DNA-binding CsgD family transcriptional regulator
MSLSVAGPMQKANFDGPHESHATLFEADVHLVRDRVVLRLREHSGGALTLERGIWRADGSSLILIHAIDDQDTLRDFASADLYAEHLRVQYHSIESICAERRLSSLSTSLGYSSDVLDAIGRVGTCENEAELMAMVGAILKHLGIGSYAYRWIHADEKSKNVREQRCLIGCHPGWMHTYFRHQWYGKDALLDYARRKTAPTVGSEIEAYRQDRSLQLLCAKYGFSSILVCAAHPPASPLFGVLQVGNDRAPPAGEHALWKNRVLIRAIASEMLDWRVAALREEATRATDLDSREIAVLRLLRNGRTACNVADSLGISERSVYVIFRKINQKLGVSHIARAVERASANGLIE